MTTESTYSMAHLTDTEFLAKLDSAPIKTQYIKIVLLDYEEKPIREITGQAKSGSITINGNATIRRVLTLALNADSTTNNLENIENLISLNKKIQVFIGYKNPFKNYAQYGETVWFKGGTYVVTNATISSNTSGCTINISGKDKMAFLDGSIGGTLPAATVLNEIYIYDDDGNLTIETPTVYQIIYELLTHFGEETDNNIMISDLPEMGYKLVKYIGEAPMWLTEGYTSFVITEDISSYPGFVNRFTYGQDVGYMPTDFVYPGELNMSAGDSVASAISKICSMLGNHEFYYDLDGKFVFQEKKNYLNSSYTPLTQLYGENYVRPFTDSKYAYSLTSGQGISSITNNPNYENIKNDFVVWGSRTTITGVDIPIRYHLVVDTKPTSLNRASSYMWEIWDKDKDEDGEEIQGENLLRYEYTVSKFGPSVDSSETFNMVGIPCYEWREELYRGALESSLIGARHSYYDEELLAEWRDLYDTMNDDWKDTWENEIGTEWSGWNPDVQTSPSLLNYWLDFVDAGSEVGDFTVSAIGRRTKVDSDTNLSTIMNDDYPDLLFITPDEAVNYYDGDMTFDEVMKSEGQSYVMIQNSHLEYFQISTTGASCYDRILELMYNHFNYNTQVSITAQPRYYLEPNALIRVEESTSGVMGDFVVSQITVPLSYNGTMSISATQSLTRI